MLVSLQNSLINLPLTHVAQLTQERPDNQFETDGSTVELEWYEVLE